MAKERKMTNAERVANFAKDAVRQAASKTRRQDRRDAAAFAVMTGMLANPNWPLSSPRRRAVAALKIADAVLAELDKPAG